LRRKNDAQQCATAGPISFIFVRQRQRAKSPKICRKIASDAEKSS
jgi:hypothetical protein